MSKFNADPRMPDAASAAPLPGYHDLHVPSHVPPELVRDFDYFKLESIDDDIHLAWRRLQDGPAVFYTPHNGGHWVATRAEDIEAIFLDPANFSSREATIPGEGKPIRLPLLEVDPPEHTAWRQLLVPLFSPKAIGAMAPFARQLTIDLIEGFRPRGECEFIAEFSQQMPVGVLLRMADLPFSDRAWLLPRAEANTRTGTAEEQRAAFSEIMEYVSDKLGQRRGRTGADLLTVIANAVVNGRAVAHDEAVGLASLVMFAGLDTVVAMLGHFMRYLAVHPGPRRALRERPELLKPAIEELLRRHGVTQMARIVVRDYTYKGVQMRSGDMVLLPTLLYGLDESRFPNAVDVDFGRQDKYHLAFGAGVHRCIGSVLARTELQILLEEWLARIPDFWLKPGERVEVRSGKVNAISRLPLAWR